MLEHIFYKIYNYRVQLITKLFSRTALIRFLITSSESSGLIAVALKNLIKNKLPLHL